MFRPLKGNLLVKYKHPIEETRGGIILVNQNPNRPVDGQVVSVGELENLTVDENDRVLFQFSAGKEVEIAGETYYILEEEYVLGVKKAGMAGFFNVPDTALYVINLEKGEHKTRSGIIVTDDHMTERGIRPRWAQIWQVGSKWTDEFQSGDWVLLEHGNWSHIIELTSENGDKIEMQIIEDKSILRGALATQSEKPDTLDLYGI